MINLPLGTRIAACVAAIIFAAAIDRAIAANADQVQQLKDTHSCPTCDLTDAQLMGVPLANADLSGANLSNANLYGVNLRGANLTGAVLNGANLKLANLAGAVGADLSGAVMDERTTCPDGNHGPSCN